MNNIAPKDLTPGSDEMKQSGKYFVLFLTVGIIIVLTIFLLEVKGITSWISIGSMRLDDQQQQSYLQKIQILPSEKLAKKLKYFTNNKVSVNNQGELTAIYGGDFLDKKGDIRNYQSVTKVNLAQLDQMIFGSKLKNRDRWSIELFCLKKITCITNTFTRGSKEGQVNKSYGSFTEIDGTDNARFVLSILSRLIKDHGGKAELDQTRGVFFIFNEYKNP